MNEYPYLILGGGMAADSAVRGIRSQDASSPIGIITRESYPCYDRPPLSKGLWTGGEEEMIWLQTEREGATFHLDESVLKLDPEKKEVHTTRTTYRYGKLLIATGVSPKRLGEGDEGVVYLHDLADYRALRTLYSQGERFAVIGSGYIGTEIAAALAMNGKEVTLLFPGFALYHKKVPRAFATFLNAYFAEKGVRLRPEQKVAAIARKGELFHLTSTTGEEIVVDGVIAGIGCTPNLSFVEGLAMSNGLEVNAQLQTSHPDIYAAGDVALFTYPLIERKLRIEHEDAARTMGFCAGENMAGKNKAFTYLPYFYSEMFELGYEAVGLLGHDFEMVEEWEDLYRKGTIYYCQNGVVRGAMRWGIWGEMESIREMIAHHSQPV